MNHNKNGFSIPDMIFRGRPQGSPRVTGATPNYWPWILRLSMNFIFEQWNLVNFKNFNSWEGGGAKKKEESRPPTRGSNEAKCSESGLFGVNYEKLILTFWIAVTLYKASFENLQKMGLNNWLEK